MQAFLQRCEQFLLVDFQRKPRNAGGGIVAAAGARALPDVKSEMVMIAAGGQEGGTIALTRRIKADGTAIKAVDQHEITDAVSRLAYASPSLTMPGSPARPDAPCRLVIETPMRMQLIRPSSTMNGMIDLRQPRVNAA
jgi:hypothetical protein